MSVRPKISTLLVPKVVLGNAGTGVRLFSEMSAPPNLRVKEIKAFVPARDFELSKQFYKDIGFTMASDNLMMHLLVEDVDAWWNHIQKTGVAAKYKVRVTNIELRPWRMRDFCLIDPSGVLWRIGQNVD
jgi:uncharacterized glyoxalase superfamily protein PhnB